MKHGSHRFVRRLVVALLLAILSAWLLPPFFSAERYRVRLEAGLRQALSRSVSFRSVSFRVLWRPGFKLHKAVVREDAAFGSEPFVRVDSIDCALRWRSLLLSRIDCARLSLDHPTFNVVNNSRGEWNLEDLLRKTSIASAVGYGRAARLAGGLELDADDGRINFKVGENKKPFAITDLNARLYLDRAHGLIRYDLKGRPVRTDVSLPAPGAAPAPGLIQLTGDWKPGNRLEGPLQARLSTGKSLLYDWIPLLTGRNPEIYGVLSATADITGSLEDLAVEGDCQITQLHRWELPPPSDSMPVRLQYRGEFNRHSARVRIGESTGSLGDSSFRLAGSLEHVLSSPQLDLVLSLDRTYLDDLVALGRRFWGDPRTFGISGSIGGLLSIHGPTAALRYSGLLRARGVRVRTSFGAISIPEAGLRIDSRGAQLLPVRIALTQGVDATLEGSLYSPVRALAMQPETWEGPKLGVSGKTPRTPRRRLDERVKQKLAGARRVGAAGDPALRYELVLSGKNVALAGIVRFIRSRAPQRLQNLEIEQGTATGLLRMAGRAWPPQPPEIESRFDLEGTRLLVPGVNEALNVSQAHVDTHVEKDGRRILVSPLTAEIAHSSFTGRLELQGDATQPWKFDLRVNKLSLEQASQWFEALGRPAPASLLDRIPGFSSFITRRTAALNLFRALDAEGTLSASTVTYRSLALSDFHAAAAVSGRVVRVSKATFRSGGGLGEGHVTVDMTAYPAHINGEVSLDRANLQALSGRMPASLKGMRGLVSGSAQFETTGLNHHDMSSALQALATLRLRDISFGEFDPLDTLARETNCGRLEPSRREVSLRDALWSLQVRDQRVFLVHAPAEITGARLQLAGSYAFDGTLDIGIRCDFRHMARRWQKTGPALAAGFGGSSAASQSDGDPATATAPELHLSGPLDSLTLVPTLQISHSTR